MDVHVEHEDAQEAALMAFDVVPSTPDCETAASVTGDDLRTSIQRFPKPEMIHAILDARAEHFVRVERAGVGLQTVPGLLQWRHHRFNRRFAMCRQRGPKDHAETQRAQSGQSSHLAFTPVGTPMTFNMLWDS